MEVQTMLLLTRNADESIIIDGDIKITVLEISGSQVRIGIDAPADVKVYREEVYKRIQSEKDAAWTTTTVKLLKID